mgnify:FL=1
MLWSLQLYMYNVLCKSFNFSSLQYYSEILIAQAFITAINYWYKNMFYREPALKTFYTELHSMVTPLFKTYIAIMFLTI